MGRTIQEIALKKGHKTPLIIDIDQSGTLDDLSPAIDVAIEFSRPEVAVQNISACLLAQIPIVSGTTGWLDHWDQIIDLCNQKKGAFFYASNYSVGVNIFFAMNRWLAQKMNEQFNYDVEMTEIHHTEKLDAPSGTAITLAEDILENLDRKQEWINEPTREENLLPIISQRIAKVAGTHTIQYDSVVDTITIEHKAHSRLGFAQGALTAAEWLVGKNGVFGMQDMLKF